MRKKKKMFNQLGKTDKTRYFFHMLDTMPLTLMVSAGEESQEQDQEKEGKPRCSCPQPNGHPNMEMERQLGLKPSDPEEKWFCHLLMYHPLVQLFLVQSFLTEN